MSKVTLLVEKLDNFKKVESILKKDLSLEYKTKGSVAFDLIAAIPEMIRISIGDTVLIPTGIKVVVPEGYSLQVTSRSSAVKTGLMLVNGVGIIDQDYRGELFLAIARPVGGLSGNKTYIRIQPGDRLAQASLVKVSIADFEYGTVENNTDRGEGGFGSTGK